MAAGKYNIVIQQGSDFVRTFQVTKGSVPVDLTGAEVRGMVRIRFDDENPIATFTVDTADLATGSFTVTLPNAVTEVLDFETAFYDIEVEKTDGTVDRVVQGRVVFSKEVTK